MLRSLREDQEGSAQVRGDDFVEGLHVALGNGRKRHDARVVDHDVDLSEGFDGFLEELFDVFGIGNVGLNCEGTTASGGDLVDDFFCVGSVAGIVDDDAESVYSRGEERWRVQYRGMRRLR